MKIKHRYKIFSLLALSGLAILFACGEDEVDNQPPERVDASAAANAMLLVNGQSTQFDDNSAKVASRTWNFPGGKPESSHEASVSVMYEFAGDYQASLSVKYETGLSELIEIPIKVLPDLKLVIGASAETNNSNQFTVSETEQIQFTDESIGEADEWLWTFEGGDPATSTERNPLVTYAAVGTFDVGLKVTRNNPDGAAIDSTMTDLVEVTEIVPVTAAFQPNSYIIFPGETVSFTDVSTGTRDSWEWVFEGGLPGSSTKETPPEVTYNTQGRYGVSLTSYKESIKDVWPHYTGEIDIPGYITVQTPVYVCDASDANRIACGNWNGDSDDTSEWIAVDNDRGTHHNANISRVFGVGGRDASDGHILYKHRNDGLVNLKFASTKFTSDGTEKFLWHADIYAEPVEGSGKGTVEMTIYPADDNLGGASVSRQWKGPNDTNMKWKTQTNTKAEVLPAGEYIAGFRLYGGTSVNWHIDNVIIEKVP